MIAAVPVLFIISDYPDMISRVRVLRLLVHLYGETQIKNSYVSQKFKIKPGDFELVWNEEINTSGYELCRKGISCMDEKIERYIESLHQADR